MAVVSLLVTVTLPVAVCPTATLPRLRLVGLKVSGRMPVPVRGTSCGLLAASSRMVRAPETLPDKFGLNVTLIVQLEPDGSDPGQLFVWAKSPLAVMGPTDNGFVPVLFSVMVFAALVVPAACFVKVNLVGVTVALPPPVLVPLRTRKGLVPKAAQLAPFGKFSTKTWKPPAVAKSEARTGAVTL